MWFFGKAASSHKRKVKRSDERFTTDLLSTSLGPVVDLSSGGMRIRVAGRVPYGVGQLVSITLQANQCHIPMKARVCYIRRNAGRSADVGVAFVEVKQGVRAAIHNLAKYGFIPQINFSNAPADPGPAGRTTAKRVVGVPDYYGLLRIAPQASAEEVRNAYHVAAKRYHPDSTGAESDQAMFQAIVEAYRILRDPAARRVYDAKRQRSQAA